MLSSLVCGKVELKDPQLVLLNTTFRHEGFSPSFWPFHEPFHPGRVPTECHGLHVHLYDIAPPIIISFVCNLFAILLPSAEYAVKGSFGSNTVKICHLELSLNLCRFFKVSDQIVFALHSQFSLLTANRLAAPPLISCFPTCCCPAAERRTANFVRVIVSVTHLIFPLGSCPL